MKVLLFTHKNDIDGMGSIVLSKLCFSDVTVVPCETFSITSNVKKYIDNNEIYKYDYIYVTDLCIKEPLLKQIDNDLKLKNRIKVIDHHKSEIDEGNNKYDYVNVTVLNELGKCSGTSLFYEEMLNNKYINHSPAIDEFVELTREYDTWEWKEIYSNPKARNLSILFDMLGIDKYVNAMLEKAEDKELVFTNDEIKLIDFKKELINKKVVEYANKIVIREIDGYKAGICFIDYDYRNDLADYLKKIKCDIDFVMMIMLDRDNISYRQIKKGVDVSIIARLFGGKGHKEAGANPISSEKKDEIIKILCKRM